MKYNFYIILLLFIGCAGQMPPDGGEFDLEPPKIITTSLPNNSTNFKNGEIIFGFSEYVDKRSVEESIFISPPIGEIEFDWSDYEVTLKFSEILRSNTTYSISFGTDIVDLNNRNRMSESFNYSFSTGNNIDRGIVSGRVFDIKPDGVLIGAYLLKNSNDTINPANKIPDYITQTGKNGNYQFLNLVPGLYRIFAFRDEFRNLKYDVEVDAIGIPSKDIIISKVDSTETQFNFKLEVEDISSPRLISAKILDENRITFLFSEPIKSSSLKLENIILTDTITLQQKKLQGIILTSDEIKDGIIITEKLSTSNIILEVLNVEDLSNNKIKRSNGKVRVTGEIPKNKIKPNLIYSSLSDTLYLQQLNPQIKFTFNELIGTDSVKIKGKMLSFDSINVPILLSITDGNINIKPKVTLNSNSVYFLNLTNDSTYKYKFYTIDPENVGSIIGVIETSNDKKSTNYNVEIEKIIIPKVKSKNIVSVKKGESFNIENIEPGNVAIFSFADENINGKYDGGKIFPFKTSEKFNYYKDTLRVRARWPIEGVVIRFP